MFEGDTPMRIYICRHGEAQPHAMSGRDLDRRLTQKGRLQARYLASVLGGLDPAERPRRLLASPAARTLETAQALADELGLGITTLRDLLPNCETGVAMGVIERHLEHEHLVVVGHNPTMTSLLSVLAHGPSAGCSMPGPALKTGHMAIVDVAASCNPGTATMLALHRYEPATVT